MIASAAEVPEELMMTEESVAPVTAKVKSWEPAVDATLKLHAAPEASIAIEPLVASRSKPPVPTLTSARTAFASISAVVELELPTWILVLEPPVPRFIAPVTASAPIEIAPPEESIVILSDTLVSKVPVTSVVMFAPETNAV